METRACLQPFSQLQKSLPLVLRFYFPFLGCYGGALKKKFSYSSTDSRFMEKCGNICPLSGTAEAGERSVLCRHENRNIDLFCSGFATLLMITCCFLGLLRGGFLPGRLTAGKMWSSVLTPSILPSAFHLPHLPLLTLPCRDLSPISLETSSGSKPVPYQFTVLMKSGGTAISFPIFSERAKAEQCSLTQMSDYSLMEEL